MGKREEYSWLDRTICRCTYISSTFGALPLVASHYAVGTSGLNTDYEAIAQTYTELVFQCPQAITANESAAAGSPTWRYLFNATFANTQDGSFKVYLLDLILDFLIVPTYILHHGEKPVRAEGEPNTGRRQTAKELKQEEKDEEAKGSEELDQTVENREHY